jgi:hypothetical protein
MWQDVLKQAGISVHVIATGGGAGLQNELWSQPGCSAYLSGASFPYAQEEQEELLGFMPEHFCSREAAVDLASAAYMKAYRFGGKKPVGVGITASVASEKVHRGEHQVFVCVISDDKVRINHQILTKGIGAKKRQNDGFMCDDIGSCAVLEALTTPTQCHHHLQFEDATELAKSRFFARPFFSANGKRLVEIPHTQDFYDPYVLFSGAFNPPHEGHFGPAHNLLQDYGLVAVYEVTATPPHKDALTVQQLLQRAKLLQGHDRIFTQNLPYYIDKARAFPGMPLMLGADAMVRMLDPKWGLEIMQTFTEFQQLHTKLYINGRDVDGKFTTRQDIEDNLPSQQAGQFHYLSHPVRGEWHLSSTEIRNKLL